MKNALGKNINGEDAAERIELYKTILNHIWSNFKIGKEMKKIDIKLWTRIINIISNGLTPQSPINPQTKLNIEQSIKKQIF